MGRRSRPITTQGETTPAGAPECTKHYYPDQASARLGLVYVQKKTKAGARAPHRVHPCDRCDGWHVTSKKVRGKKPPWDTDPNWSRPGGRVTRKGLS